MEIHVTFDTSGTVRVETISILEDLWHDFLHFKARASELQKSAAFTGNYLLAKRYWRAALLALVCYFEGVVNQWLQLLLTKSQWRKAQQEPLDAKVETIHKRCLAKQKPAISEIKRLRNMLVHLKPGKDGALYERIGPQALDAAEAQITEWLTHMEVALCFSRHPDTRAESKLFTKDLGINAPGGEGYTGDSDR